MEPAGFKLTWPVLFCSLPLAISPLVIPGLSPIESGLMASPSTYTPEQRAAALAALQANGGNVGKTAKQVGIPPRTIRGWAGGKNPAGQPLIKRVKDDMAGAIEGIAWRVITRMRKRDVLGKASLPQLAVTLGICVEKMKLLRGEAGNINRHESVSIETLDVSKLTADELRTLIALHDKASPNKSAPAGPQPTALPQPQPVQVITSASATETDQSASA